MDNYDSLKNRAIELGADLFGVAETIKLEKYLAPEIADAAESLPYVVSIAVRLQRKVLESLTDGPNLIYKAHYRQANSSISPPCRPACWYRFSGKARPDSPSRIRSDYQIGQRANRYAASRRYTIR
jgi:hypothetical protein